MHKRICPHDLRYTYTTLQRKEWQSIEVVSNVLWHANELVTPRVYTHWAGDLRALADIMDKTLGKAPQKHNEEHAFEIC